MTHEFKKQAELQDLLLAVKRYLTVNHQNVTFIYSFIAYKKDEESSCIDCGEQCERVDNEKSTIGMFGDLGELRKSLEMLRDMAEDEMDENGFVNIIE